MTAAVTLVLAGMRVLVTRPADAASTLLTALVERGAVARAYPMVATAPTAEPAALADALARLDAYQWIVFTSAAGVRFSLAGSPAQPPTARVAAIGTGTARALRERGWTVDWQPSRPASAALAEELPVRPAERILLLRSDRADRTLPAALEARGARVDDVPAYQTVPRAATDPALRAQLLAGEIDAIVLASPSAVEGLVNTVGREAADAAGGALVAIGPTTAAALAARGLPRAAQAARPDVEGILAALIDLRGGRDGG